MNKIVKYLILLAVISMGIFMFYNKVYVPKTTYQTISPEMGSLNVEVFGIGNVGAQNIYTIHAQMGGKIVSILSDEGKWVKKGDLLVTMDTVDIPKLLEEAKLSVKKANFELEASKKELHSLKSQKDLALITHKRSIQLRKTTSISQADYDKSKSNLAVFTAQIDAAKAHINAAQTEIIRVEKSGDALEIKLSRYKIQAPVDGYVISRDAEVAQSVTPSKSILTIVDSKTIWIKAYIDERISADVKVGQKAHIILRSQRDKKFNGYVKRIVAKSDAVTGEREVNIAFDALPIPFYMNEQAEVIIDTKHLNNIVKIPSYTIVYKDEKVGVWIHKNGKAHFQNLKIIARGEKTIAVSGVDKNTKILISNPKNKVLKEGVSIHL